MTSRMRDIGLRAERGAASLRFWRLAALLRRSDAFDAPWYRAAYPDSTSWDAAVHFLAIGARNGHRPHLLFDAQWWLERRGGPIRAIPFVDYLTSPERWTIPPSPYLALRHGLAPAQLPRHASPLGLYRSSDGIEGLEPSPLFDAGFYARNNPDVVAAGLDPFLHFISNGGREGRSPSASFDAFGYLAANPDVKARGDEPLRHFITRGVRQGRPPHRAIDPAMLLARSSSTDVLQALGEYQTEGRLRLDAHTHTRLPPPGAAAPLFDDWPWRNPAIPSARGRLLVLVAGADDAGLPGRLAALAASSSGPEPWLVALDAAGAAILDGLAAPLLDLGAEPSGTLPALLRAAAFAGPHISAEVAAAPGHAAHALVAQSGLAPVSLAMATVAERPSAATISVVVPSYNHGAFLDGRLASILAQRRAPCEIIVIDDASTDDSVAQARVFADAAPLPVRVIARGHNSGSPFAAWAEGARLARGDLLWIAESDDIADPRLLERLAPFLERDPQTMLAYCQSAAIGARGERLADDHLFYTDEIDPRRWEAPYHVPGEAEIAQALAIKNTIPNVSAVLFRRQALADISAQIVADRYCGDWRAYALLAERGSIGFSPEPLNSTRRHGGNATLAGERSAVAMMHEAQEIRLSLWRRPGTPPATIRAGLAQHRRECEIRQGAQAQPGDASEALRREVETLLATKSSRELSESGDLASACLDLQR